MFDPQIGIVVIVARAANAYAGLKKLGNVVPARRVYFRRGRDACEVCPLTAIFLHETKTPLPADSIAYGDGMYARLMEWAVTDIFEGSAAARGGFIFGVDFPDLSHVQRDSDPMYKFGRAAGRRAVERFKLATPT